MTPTQTSLTARLGNKILDGGSNDVSLWRANRIRVFLRNSEMDNKMFSITRHSSLLCILPVNSSEQNGDSCKFYFPSLV